MSHLQIYTYIIISSILFGISEFLKAIASETINNGVFQLYYYLVSALMVPVIFIFIDKDFTIKNLTTLTKNDVLLIAISGVIMVIINYFYISAFRMNSELKLPINVGILSAILALYFIITIIADIFVKIWKKETVYISRPQIIGSCLIIAGIITITIT
jgi:uncharacterized membrane protein